MKSDGVVQSYDGARVSLAPGPVSAELLDEPLLNESLLYTVLRPCMANPNCSMIMIDVLVHVYLLDIYNIISSFNLVKQRYRE